MSIIVIGNQVVHYEVLGHGRPVIFLHGWLGSWRYWFPTMEVVGKHFRSYSFDFLGFGNSNHRGAPVSVSTYSDQVIRFMDALGIDQAMLVGHSMGGMVAMKTAIIYPDRVQRVVTVGAPFTGDSLAWFLKLTNYPIMANAFARWTWLRRNMFRFFMGNVKDPSVQEILNDAVKSSAHTLRSTVGSMMQTNMRSELSRLRTPALIVHGGRDDIVNPRQVDLFNPIPSAEILILHNSRHFPFFDEIDIFNEILLQFLRQTALDKALLRSRLQVAPMPGK
ncbi:MAG: alpha/beta hydrolase [Chloroflexaceae bacterium]|nr:alpha/beta hydrolase [Chloroflexaceae bacterium]NJO06419.1 alpha/beta hydrolase [Chloroflexaceae bacterium]